MASSSMRWSILQVVVIYLSFQPHGTEAQRPAIIPSEDECGQSLRLNYARIGNQTDPGDWPWLAAIGSLEDERFTLFCAGTLITKQHVISAASCFSDDIPNTIVRLGEYNVTIPNTEDGAIDFRIIDKRVGENYNTETNENDIILLKLDKPLDSFTDSITPSCLPYHLRNAKFEGENLIAFGWGQYNNSITLPSLVPLELPNEEVVPVPECQQIYDEVKGINVDNKHLCAGGMVTDACKGDHGGPLDFVDIKRGRFYTVGISLIPSCWNIGKPGIYTRIGYYLDWIEESIREMSVDTDSPPTSTTSTATTLTPPSKPSDCRSDPDCPMNKACINKYCVDPCIYNGTACGLNTECRAVHHRAQCYCPPGMQGEPMIACNKVGCTTHEDCETDKSCDRQNRVCVPVCESNTCAPEAECRVSNHTAICYCPLKIIGKTTTQCNEQVRCTTHEDCEDDKACDHQHRVCVPVCEHKACAPQAECRASNHTAVCYCPSSLIGNGLVHCYEQDSPPISTTSTRTTPKSPTRPTTTYSPPISTTSTRTTPKSLTRPTTTLPPMEDCVFPFCKADDLQPISTTPAPSLTTYDVKQPDPTSTIPNKSKFSARTSIQFPDESSSVSGSNQRNIKSWRPASWRV